MHAMTQIESKPWYRQFWPWFLIAIPSSSVVMGVVMINLAMSGNDSLVRKDWYKDGMAINQRMEKRLKAKQMGIKAALTLDQQTGDLFVDADNIDVRTETELTLQLIHPTLEKNDRTLQLYLAPNDRYYAKLDFEPKGMYYLLLTTASETWEIESSVNFSNPLKRQELVPSS